MIKNIVEIGIGSLIVRNEVVELQFIRHNFSRCVNSSIHNDVS
jgi:hypothetical protein